MGISSTINVQSLFEDLACGSTIIIVYPRVGIQKSLEDGLVEAEVVSVCKILTRKRDVVLDVVMANGDTRGAS
jgi:hypothetical protein